MKNTKGIYDLELMEFTQVGKDMGWIVTRVPGGWIYQRTYNPTATTFVPYNEEFKKNNIQEKIREKVFKDF